MTFDEVPVVILVGVYEKYAVAQLKDEKTGVTKILIRSGSYLSDNCLHADIYDYLWQEELKSDASSFSIKRMGGGRILVVKEIKRITILDNSMRYGKEPDRQETARLIQEAYPDFTIEIRD